jgi:hypothetical protein
MSFNFQTFIVPFIPPLSFSHHGKYLLLIVEQNPDVLITKIQLASGLDPG